MEWVKAVARRMHQKYVRLESLRYPEIFENLSQVVWGEGHRGNEKVN